MAGDSGSSLNERLVLASVGAVAGLGELILVMANYTGARQKSLRGLAFFAALISNSRSSFRFDLTIMFPSDDRALVSSSAAKAAALVITVGVLVVRVVGVVHSAPSRAGRK
jgi:hypothetical protein